jgi:hypothetical protein
MLFARQSRAVARWIEDVELEEEPNVLVRV